MTCPQGLIVLDYSCGLLQRDTGDCTRGQPCPESGKCCEVNPVAIGIIIACSLFCFCCCCALIGFCCYKMCCSTSQSSGANAGMKEQPTPGQPQVIVLQQGAPVGQVQQVDQNGNPIMAPAPQPGQAYAAENPIAQKDQDAQPQSNPVDQKNLETGYPEESPTAPLPASEDL